LFTVRFAAKVRVGIPLSEVGDKSPYRSLRPGKANGKRKVATWPGYTNGLRDLLVLNNLRLIEIECHCPEIEDHFVCLLQEVALCERARNKAKLQFQCSPLPGWIALGNGILVLWGARKVAHLGG
jgi:hypothetical protein